MNILETLDSLEVPTLAFQIALGGIAISAAVLWIARLLRRRSEPLRYGVLFAGVIGLLAVPALVGVGRGFQDSLPSFASPQEDEIVRVPLEALDRFLAQPEAEVPDEIEAASVNPGPIVAAVLLALWALGTILGLLRLAFGLWKQSRALIGPVWRADFWTDELQAQLAQKLGLSKFPEVRVSPAAPMPMVIGILRPTIVLPESAPATWQQPQWEAVLLHEAAHIARRDPWAALAQRVAVVLFWWCPLVHLMGRRLNELRESICDDCALQGQCDHIEYAELLVDSAERFLDCKTVPVPLGLLDSARGGLEARVLRLLERERKPMVRLSLPGKLLGASLLVGACLLTTAATAFSQAQAQPGKKVQIKIVVDGKEIDLGDGKLLELIAAAQQKAAADKPADVIKFKINKLVEMAYKDVTFTPDGKLLVTFDGKTVTVHEAATGKLIAKHAHDAATIEQHLAQWVAKPDPRIEELVKKAEANMPGSGAEVRRALQAAPKAITVHATPGVPFTPATPAFQAVPAVPGAQVWRIVEGSAGKKLIILSIEDGKVKQLSEQDLKKLVEKSHHFHFDIDVKKTETKPKVTTNPAIEFEFKSPLIAPKVADKKPAAPDLDALSRQLERINAELRDLRKRLEDSKK